MIYRRFYYFFCRCWCCFFSPSKV